MKLKPLCYSFKKNKRTTLLLKNLKIVSILFFIMQIFYILLSLVIHSCNFVFLLKFDRVISNLTNSQKILSNLKKSLR